MKCATLSISSLLHLLVGVIYLVATEHFELKIDVLEVGWETKDLSESARARVCGLDDRVRAEWGVPRQH